MKNIFARIHKVLALFIAVGVFLQMFLAGVWHAGVVDTPDAHIFFGLSMLLAALVALIAGLPKAVIVRTTLLFFLILLQPFLMEARRNGLPLVSALHTLNAPFIGIVASMVFEMARGVQMDDTVSETAVAANTQQLTVETMRFGLPELRLKAGEAVTLALDNRDLYGHSFDVDALDLHVDMPANGQVATSFTPTEPGKYDIYCNVPGHREAGMVSTLIVEK